MASKKTEMPAIGISLTATYGTVSARFADGSFQDLARVEADGEYTQMMKRLAEPSSGHPSPPYGSAEEYWQDVPRQLIRSGRKKIGLAASSDVAQISKLLKALIDEASEASTIPHTSFDEAIISYPAVLALYNEDITDAASHAGVRTLTGQASYQPREIVAAYAGVGLGLCEHYENIERCRNEGLMLPSRHTLLLELTASAVIAQHKHMREATDLPQFDIAASSFFDLENINDNPEAYDNTIKNLVKRLMIKEIEYLDPPEELLVLFTGSADESSFKHLENLAKEAVSEIVQSVVVRRDNPEYTAARGAAELGWRAKALV